MRTSSRLAIVLLTLLGLLVVSSGAPTSADRLGPGHAGPPGFSGYTTGGGQDLGIARLPNGALGICLDTGSLRWPQQVSRARSLTHPVVGYLLSTRIGRARHDGVLAAALWWVVGKTRGLNSAPRRMQAHLDRLRKESPRLHRRVVRTARALVRDAHLHAAPHGGYVAPRPILTTDGPTGTLTGLGLRSARARWVPGVVVRVTLTGATFGDGRSTQRFTTTSTPRALRWTRLAGEAVKVRVTFERVPHHRYLLHRPGKGFQRVAASAGRRTLSASGSTPALSIPRIATRVNRQSARVGATLVDAVTVTGTAGGSLRGEWQLLGPVAPDRSHRCRRAQWSGAPVAGSGTFAVTGDSTVQVGRTRIGRGGCYTYRERIVPSRITLGTPWTPAGLVEETSLVLPRSVPVPRHPLVATGASRIAVSPTLRRTPTVRVPSRRINAALQGVGFNGRTLTAPPRRSIAGLWTGSVPLSSLVGTTVIVGHVSDRQDRPGVFHRLRRARVGDRVATTDSAGKVQRWKVVRVRSVDRTRLPRSLFAQGSERRLVLITCSDRDDRPDGTFHYRKNLIVEAVPA